MKALLRQERLKAGDKLHIILLGSPGVGKGTQAKSLAKELNLTHISTGDILRQNVKENTQLGKKAKEYMNKGELVPDELVNQMLIEKINCLSLNKGFILDGYHRNVPHAKTLDNFLKKVRENKALAIYLYASESVIIERLAGRRICSLCQAVFHLKNMPPKKDLICDYCGGRLYQRTDDQEETIKRRLNVYLKEASSLLDYYEKKNKLYRLSADEEADVVLNKMLEILNQSSV